MAEEQVPAPTPQGSRSMGIWVLPEHICHGWPQSSWQFCNHRDPSNHHWGWSWVGIYMSFLGLGIFWILAPQKMHLHWWNIKSSGLVMQFQTSIRLCADVMRKGNLAQQSHSSTNLGAKHGRSFKSILVIYWNLQKAGSRTWYYLFFESGVMTLSTGLGR